MHARVNTHVHARVNPHTHTHKRTRMHERAHACGRARAGTKPPSTGWWVQRWRRPRPSSVRWTGACAWLPPSSPSWSVASWLPGGGGAEWGGAAWLQGGRGGGLGRGTSQVCVGNNKSGVRGQPECAPGDGLCAQLCRRSAWLGARTRSSLHGGGARASSAPVAWA